MQFHVINATCPVCVDDVKNAFEKHHFPEVESLSSNGLRKTITITLKESCFNEENTFEEVQAKFLRAFLDTGFECAVDRSEKNHLFKGIIGAVSVLVGALLIAFSLSGLAVPLALIVTVVGLSSLLTLYLGLGSYIDAVKKLVKSKKITMDSLFMISTLTVIGVSIASFFVPWLPMILETGVLIFGFRLVGEAIKEWMREEVATKLTFKDRAPKRVERKSPLSDDWEMCDADKLEVGDVIKVKQGQYLPVDGISKSKNASLLKSIKNGAIAPSHVDKDEEVLAGMKVCSEDIEVLVSQPVCDSFLSKLDQRNENLNEKAPLQTITERIMQWFVPGIILLGALSGILVGFIFNPALGIQCAISLFVSACPCTLGIIPQLAFMIGLNKATDNGVSFKSNAALEAANEIDTVVFDLNGTLTTGVPEVVNYELVSEEVDLDEFFDSLTAIEKCSEHPVAKAIAAYKPKTYKGGAKEFVVSKVDSSHHSGIKAKVNGDSCLVGNSQFLLHHNIDNPFENEEAGHVIYYVKNKKVIGYLELEDPLRDGAEAAVRELMRMGKKVYLCTGSDNSTAQYYAKQLEIDQNDVYAGMLPIPMSDVEDEDEELAEVDNKLLFIRSLQDIENKKVAMIGDAGNDARAVKESTFGIAVTSASDPMTKYEADAVTEGASLLPILTAFAVSKETILNIKANLVFSLIYNVLTTSIAGGVLIPLGFMLNPAIGVALMVIQFAIVLGIQLLILNHKLPHLENQQEKKTSSLFARFFSSKSSVQVDDSEEVECLLLSEEGGLSHQVL